MFIAVTLPRISPCGGLSGDLALMCLMVSPGVTPFTYCAATQGVLEIWATR